MNMFAHEGLIGKLICGHIGTSPKLFPLITANKFPTFVVPQGILPQLARAIGAHRRGVVTSVGLKTFADPRVEGCRAKQAAGELSEDEQVVEVLKIKDKDYLLYKSFPVNVCFIKATTADVDGHLSIEKEAVRLSSLELALATRSAAGNIMRFRSSIRNGAARQGSRLIISLPRSLTKERFAVGGLPLS